ncbi:phosphoribosylaminoimidazolesuccinocarboxamide synthase [Candidatus Thorarchaeota archaeon]|nr:MAG: phosphoribosylaminoimidazolesuccinocarboxamide synthase [Candidatus Thorarchaeota archaeon]
MELIYEGKAKRVFQDKDTSDRVIIVFKDTVTAGDGAKKEDFLGKGDLTCDMSEYLLGVLESKGVDTHFIRRLQGPQLLCKKVGIFPIEVVCRNKAAGSFCSRYGIEKGTEFEEPLVEFFVKDDKLHDPLIAEDAAIRIGLVTKEQLQFLSSVTLSVNYYLGELLRQQDLVLVDFKLEFGQTEEGHIVLADEISSDTMRIWDAKSKSMDKDVFREDKDDLIETYTALLNTIKKGKPELIESKPETIQVIIEPKPGIKNPPGEVARKALNRLGFADVEDVRMGKVFNIVLRKPITSEILNQLAMMNIKLLSNPISERYKVRLE